MKWLKDFCLRKFRLFYENRINLKYGISQFLANVAYIQLTHEEFVMLNPPSAWCGDIHLTTKGIRPLLSYPVWPNGMEYPEDPKAIPFVQVIVESNEKFQIKEGLNEGDWNAVTIADPRVAPLKDMFLSFAFHSPLRSEWKKKKENV